jgi:predicted transposase YbfD/YdcC
VSADVIAFDGKTLRGSAHKKRGKAAIHMVSAFATRQRLVLGHVKVADNPNEIVAIPALLDMLVIEGAVITIDAMGCQRSIAQKTLDKKTDYLFSLKGNQSSLRDDVELFAAGQMARGWQQKTPHRRHGGGRQRAMWTRHIGDRITGHTTLKSRAAPGE